MPPDRTTPPPRTAAGPVNAPSEAINVPLSAAVVKWPVLTVSHAVAEVTGYPGFNFTELEANALAEAVAELGYNVPPWMNVLIWPLPACQEQGAWP